MDKISMYKDLFAQQDIVFRPTPFSGVYEGREYPVAYTSQQRSIVGVAEEQTYWYHRLAATMPIRDFSGIPCLAGYESIYIGTDGHLRRCSYDERILDTPLSHAAPCRVSRCGCGLLLEELNSHDPGFWNYWRPLAGLPPIPEDPRPPAEQFQSAEKKYWELLHRYRKV
jgi:hypothetical protein